MSPPTIPTSPEPADAPARGESAIACALGYARTHDALGHQIHTALAMIFAFLLPVGTAPKDFALIVLTIWWVIRLPHTWRSYLHCWRQPLIWALIAWVGWEALSLTWSNNVKQGFDELRAYRMLLTPIVLWPVLDRIPWLIAAALLGVLAENGFQLLQALGLSFRPEEAEGRFGGLLHPGHTAAWCLAAMCWSLSCVLGVRGAWRWISVVLAGIAAAGFVATEARGPGLAAIIVIPLMLLVTAIRRPALRRAALLIAAAGIIAALASWPIVARDVYERLQDARQQAHDANERGIYWSSVGLRIGMRKWALNIFREHPTKGVGAGGFEEAKRSDPSFQDALNRTRNDHQKAWLAKGHPHSLYLYTLACNGAIGAAILLVVAALSLWQCWRDPPTHPYAHASVFILLSWLIGAQFDTYNLNGTLMSLFAFVLATTLPHRPAVRYALSAKDVNESAVTFARAKHLELSGS